MRTDSERVHAQGRLAAGVQLTSADRIATILEGDGAGRSVRARGRHGSSQRDLLAESRRIDIGHQGSAGCAGEVHFQYRVQLDTVRSYTGLAVYEVKEGH